MLWQGITQVSYLLCEETHTHTHTPHPMLNWSLSSSDMTDNSVMSGQSSVLGDTVRKASWSLPYWFHF